MVDLVLDYPCLEPRTLKTKWRTAGTQALNNYVHRSRNITREIGHAHASLPLYDLKFAANNDGIEHHKLAMAHRRVLVRRTVDRKDSTVNANLWRCESHTRWRSTHRIDEINCQFPRLVIDDPERRTRNS
jgi:hypothetical protein